MLSQYLLNPRTFLNKIFYENVAVKPCVTYLDNTSQNGPIYN